MNHHHEEHHGGYEDPAQRPTSKEGPTGFDHPSEPRGRWPRGTLFAAVVVVLLCGLLILAIAGLIATR
ncbi:hypothetical protein E1262_25095 [Jiangella aurantiaca]|uniref:Uncharacterized protein n=1 Tax=Jiangella aurantiaca TaxID=2530373 RepID=A0A4R5A392_9ACTN|nr:hypothetical protein [Jiangella aurantiaca]TDD65460.1 hypothetical protein E1262_25095 [Jiangella aurantiaca]